MDRKEKISKTIHFFSTAWFIACVIYLLMLTLFHAGFRLWIIFSLSGYSAVIIFIFVSLYLFAIFRSVDRSQKLSVEHPLTATSYYAFFYDVSPFLGGIAGAFAIINFATLRDFLLPIGYGTFLLTFLVWIIIDPLIAYVETLLPACRRCRLERLAKESLLKKEKQREKEHLIATVLQMSEQKRLDWQQVLQPYAEKLAEIIYKHQMGKKSPEDEILEIGVKAWQMGRLDCMQAIHNMTLDVYKKKYNTCVINDLIPTYWDGIGGWRYLSPS